MANSLTIEEAARKAIEIIGKPTSISEIYRVITERDYYEFNTPVPEHVLRTTIRRATSNVERVDSKTEIQFTMTEPEVYGLAKTEAIRAKPGIALKRIHRSKDKQEIIELLTSDSLGVFSQLWRLQLFSAQIGLAHARRIPLESVDSGKGIDQSTFGNCGAWPGILYLIAITEANSAEPLSSHQSAEDYRISAFEEYSNGGLDVLREFFRGRSIDLNGLLEFIDTNLATKSAPPSLDLAI